MRVVRILALTLLPGAVLAQPVLTSSVITPAAQAEIDSLCGGGGTYPAQFTWDGSAVPTPTSATTGTPKVEQYRNGVLIATYAYLGSGNANTCKQRGDGTDWQTPRAEAASGCGAFSQHQWRLWAPGDSFLVYAAPYTGDLQQPYVGANYDGRAAFDAGMPTTMVNVSLTGVVLNNTRPVVQAQEKYPSYNCLNQSPACIGVSSGVVWDSINVIATLGGVSGRGGLYIDGANNFVFRRSRVSNFAEQIGGEQIGAFGTGNNSGDLTFEDDEFDHNGGPNGPSHNVYINASAAPMAVRVHKPRGAVWAEALKNTTVDPNFRVIMKNSWSHDVFYGHLFKSRAQRTWIVGNYFQGGDPIGGQFSQADAYLLDVPNAGVLVARDNIFVKAKSGRYSNGVMIAYGEEGVPDSRSSSIEETNNTMVSFSRYYDDQQHSSSPFSYYTPPVLPGHAGFPQGVPTKIANNAFIGLCPTGNAEQDYRGDPALTEAFSELSMAFALLNPYVDVGNTPIGRPEYQHVAVEGVKRTKATVGAED